MRNRRRRAAAARLLATAFAMCHLAAGSCNGIDASNGTEPSPVLWDHSDLSTESSAFWSNENVPQAFSLSFPLTLLFTLEQLHRQTGWGWGWGWGGDASDSDDGSVTFDIIGATRSDEMRSAWEALPRRLATDGHITLNVFFSEPFHDTTCGNRHPRLSLRCHQGLYHRFNRPGKGKDRPSAAFIFNANIHRHFDQWEPTLNALIDSDVPTVVTTYSKRSECTHDCQRVERVIEYLGAHVIISTSQSPFPILAAHPEYGLIGKNTQYMAFRGRAHPTVQTYRLGVSSPLPSPTALFDTILAKLRADELRELARQFEMIDIQDDHFAAFVYQMADALDSGQVSLPSYLSYENVKRIAFDVYRAAARGLIGLPAAVDDYVANMPAPTSPAVQTDNDNVVLLPESDFLGSDEVDLMDDFFWASGII
ncbi:unnamed protein product [Vitrella brassicaformis CCMP3155]|uniref:Mitochondrial splicing suppressor 51-like C-terminal domain-containing protein n=2 Tax=Vitrella brassicaformis TaxID=1169539 RepID=A0A0G4G5P7_VITBC|nr:unnamed protein product [Vitrella brassicaformis CCMP3155]|eukprot:CEM23794.1 unnamed protein product [Vitrella brassicaformis CCMP3155]